MNFQSRRLLLLSLLLFLVQISFAQDDSEDYCDLPATDEIVFTALGSDYLGFHWTPVQNASAYDILIIDLNTNITTHQSTEYNTDVFIEGIEVTECTFVAITSRCSNGALGGTAGTNPGTCALIFDDLVLQVTTDDNQDIKLMCGESITDKSVPDWNTPGGPGTIDFTLNNSSIVLSGISGSHNSAGPAYSILMLGVRNGNAYSKFPSFSSLSNQTVNTYHSRSLNSHDANANINYYNNTLFYNISVDQSMSIIANLDFEYPYTNQVFADTRYCVRGTRLHFVLEEADGGSYAYRQNNDHTDRLGSITSVTSDTNASITQEIVLAPNPANDQITLRTPTAGTFKIIDIHGHIWYKADTQNKPLDISISNWPAGTYIIYLEGKDTPIVQRFIKL